MLKLISNINSKDEVLAPFLLLSLIDSPSITKNIATKFANTFYYDKNIEYKLNASHKKIRIGYFSPDFHNNHPVAYLTRELFEKHDRSKFEIYIFSFIPESNDSFQLSIKKSCDAFIDVSCLSDEEVASLAHEREIDIAIDLCGFTSHARTEIFAMRAAPIQINYLGYPGTMGVPFIDYIIADEFIIPEDKQQFYTEKVIYLPGCFQPNDSIVTPSKNLYTRKDEHLPEEGFVFCSFNNTYKLTPSMFDIWMRLLTKVKGSVLWLASCPEEAKVNLRNEATKRGIDKDRLIFASRKDLREDHLERLKLADLFLDSFPFNAHTTASDALRSGLPVLTFTGESFASRVAGSLLSSLGLQELITENQEDYEQRALEIALNNDKLFTIKSKLKNALINANLYNTEQYTKNLEKGYQAAYQRYLNKESPEHLMNLKG